MSLGHQTNLKRYSNPIYILTEIDLLVFFIFRIPDLLTEPVRDVRIGYKGAHQFPIAFKYNRS